MAKRQLTFPNLFTVNDVSQITKRSEETIRRWCRLGLVDHGTLGGEYRFSDEQVSALLKFHPAVTSRRGVRA